MISNGEEPPLDTASLDNASLDIVSPAQVLPIASVPELPPQVPAACCGERTSTTASQLAHRAGILGWLLFLGAIGTKVAGIQMPMMLLTACAAGLIGILAALLVRAVGPSETRDEWRGVLIYNAALFIPTLVWIGLSWRQLR